MANADKLIAKGMKALTSAVTDLETGVGMKEASMLKNDQKVVELEAATAEMEKDVNKTLVIIRNFRKNILGEG